jgi:hypothetical protein
MTPSEHFLRHAAECEHMAQFARDPESKAVWHSMAERWCKCAELSKKNEPVTPRRRARVHHHQRPPEEAWAQ